MNNFFAVPEELVKDLLLYLGERPVKEVFQLYVALGQCRKLQQMPPKEGGQNDHQP